ncbi:MAG TPA: hypothetical protein ENJ65_02135, partial [Candidatus Tenderia electrophaga]|nr:hypothetical protein [Candidatus Tenderia electrophaga]
MSSEVQICNQALSFLGAQLITSLDDNTVPAQLCKLHYAPLRDTVLSDGNWTFAMARRRLSADPTPPEFGWSNRYRLPNDLLRVVRVFTDASIGARRSGVEHQREGDFLLVNYGGPLYLQYIARITDPSKFSPGFIQALAAR